MPQISVIKSVYKEPLDWMAQSIDSILNQIYSDFEFLIVDDNPTDDKLIYFLNDYQKKDSRIKIIVNEQNVGLTKSLNIAIKQAQGKYIARMDADDISCKNRFQVQYDYMEQHLEVDVCGSWAYKIGEMSLLDERKIILPTCNDDIRLGFLFSSQIIHPCVFVRSEVIKIEKSAIFLNVYCIIELREYLRKLNIQICNKTPQIILVEDCWISFCQTKTSGTRDYITIYVQAKLIVRLRQRVG